MYPGPRDMLIKVIPLTGPPFVMFVRRTYTIAWFKHIIALTENIPEDKVVLSNCNEVLQNDKVIADYDLRSMATLYVSEHTEKNLNIYVKTANAGDDMIFLHVEKGDTVESVKEKIQKRLKFKLRWQSLYFRGKLLKNEWTLEECGIKEFSILDHQMKIGL